MKKFVLLLAILALAALVACSPKAAPVNNEPVAPAPTPAPAPPVAAPAPEPVVDSAPAKETDKPVAGLGESKLSTAGESCGAQSDSTAMTLEDQKAANECCTKELGIPALYDKVKSACYPIG